MTFAGYIGELEKYLVENHVVNADVWSLFVRQFRNKTDFDYKWRGEYWGEEEISLCDYAQVGKEYDSEDCNISVWLETKQVNINALCSRGNLPRLHILCAKTFIFLRKV